jgi:hypothetical protein
MENKSMKKLIFSMLTLLSLVVSSNMLRAEEDTKGDVKKDEKEEMEEEKSENRMDFEF